MSGVASVRLDGEAKVTGRAKYATEEVPQATLDAVLVGATIAAGTVTRIDATDALRVPGVLDVLTPDRLPRLAEAPVPPAAQSFMPMQDARVLYEGQPIAIVVAESLEAAEEAAPKVQIDYRRDAHVPFEQAPTVKPRGTEESNGYAFFPIDTDKAEGAPDPRPAADRLDATYQTSSRHHNPMEPAATLAEWRGDELYVHTATQWGGGLRMALAAMLDIAPQKIHVRCPYTGGGFGSKGFVWPHQVLAVLAAKAAGRPVKLNVGRAGMYTSCGFQPAVLNSVRLAADGDGRLLAIEHETTNMSSMFDDYIEFGAAGTRALYASPRIATRSRIRHCHVGTPNPMRAPHEGPGLFALESAMDELAGALKIDPLELRLRNHAERDPLDGRPFSSKKLREVYLEGAKRFGWERRPLAPRTMRDGHLSIGWGMASAIMATFRFAANARVTLRPDGSMEVSTSCHEIGNGAYTVLAEIAAEAFGIPVRNVRVTLGDTALPATGPTTGSSTTLSVGSAVQDACEKLKRMKCTDGQEISAQGSWKPHADAAFDGSGGKSGYSMHSWGAIFIEVGVDEALGLVRMRRAVGGYSAGRIINERTARSQMIGGITWGYGQALLEESAIDERSGRFLSKNLSGVMLPVNADIPDIDVFFADEYDPHASAIGARGIGELGATGVSAAIANAVWHATGKRVRRLPIRASDVLSFDPVG